ncbi:hypothetical protein [Phaeobacter sp. J2-8]|uniref:hypothetical protein n=1 Tax=Phaeobacter sp. J2-8 TaxID=2931394 RepID=UPI001FD5D596|nr:hypothetical protein [Phaeobacter sp. J2-8]MCJ7872466.1 hypothetical protein [Phaeobacter sp. J2-8]
MTKRLILGAVALLLVSACGDKGGFGGMLQPRDRDTAAVEEADTQDPSRSIAPATRPPEDAVSAEDFDTTTAQDREKAAEVPASGGETALGSTVASLGDPARPGFWLETPLVTAATKGRVEFPGSGKSAQVDLIPIDGPAMAGSRISLAAMRLIEAPLTGLPEILVFRN